MPPTSPVKDLARQRHGFVRVSPSAWADWLVDRPDLVKTAAVRRWAEERRPFVVRRASPDEGERAGVVRLGLALPPALGRHRIALSLPLTALQSVEPPPTLRDCRDAAPNLWWPSLDRLQAVETLGVEPRVFGSLAWSTMTGLEYLSPRSDLDLIVSCGSRPLHALLAVLATEAEAAPMRIDAELARPDGRAAHWRELASDAQNVLVKSPLGSELQDRQAFLEGAT